jgi:hypothetical protein
MKSTRKLLAAGAVAVVSLALVAGPASAKKPRDYAYFATIDCGSGPVRVGSGEDLWAPLVDLASGKKYKPVAWNVTVGEFVLQETKNDAPRKHAVDCSYSDGVATGTVTVKKV